jgi:PAS domain S-box-containing protein
VLHSVLERQLRKLGAVQDRPPNLEQWRALLERVSAAYVQEDQGRYTLERSIAISSREMLELNSRLATERDRLQVTVASMADGLCVLTAEGTVEIANRAAEEILGAEAGGLHARDFVGLVSGGWPPERERRAPIRDLRSAIAQRGSCRFDDARFMTLRGQSIPVSFALMPIDASPSGGSVLVFADIRARKAAEDALRESESRFRAIFESAAVGIVRLGLDGRVADCNAAYAQMLGRSRAETLGTDVFARVHPEEVDTSHKHFESVRHASSAGPQIECRYLHRDGSTVWAQQTLSFVRDANGDATFAIGVVEDITARKNLEISLRQAQKLEAVGQLASGIAHEINTPVQFVNDSVHFVREAVADLFRLFGCYRELREAASTSHPQLVRAVGAAEDAADVDYLIEQLPKAIDRALEGLQRVATIVRGMKDFAHPDHKNKSPADLNHALETTLTIARNEYKYVADVETEYGELPPVVCHVGELNQVFLNVIVNAAHAIGDVVRGTDRKGTIRVKTWREGQYALVSIADTGSGIPEAVRHRVFDPFFTTKEVGRGTGQGLAIARAVVVDKHQGELTFETAIGQGTTFTIRLPIEASEQTRAA